MKKLISVMLCIMLMVGVSGCNRKENENIIDEPSVKVSDEAEKKTEENQEEKQEEALQNEETAVAEETERAEVANNIRDIKALVEEELYDDAAMIIEALKSRDLTEEEKKEIEELEKMLEEAE